MSLETTQQLFNALTWRQRQIAEQLAGGLSSKMIADKLHIKENTVKNHRRNIMKKTESATITEAVAKCIRGGLIA